VEQNYVGKLPPPPDHTISGYTRDTKGAPVAGVNLAFSGLGSVVSDARGFYERTVKEGWSGTVTPSLGDYTWQPASRDYDNVTADMPDQNYIGKLPEPKVSCEIADVYFEFDSDVIRPESVAELNKLLDCLNAYPERTVQIEGHCCYIGTEEYNLALGEARALAIKRFLIDKGIAEARISTVSFGESRPAFDNSSEETRQYNRRDHFVIKSR
jgi:outer membrane protein OmpA-like peptidoglycan-associated protein